MKKVKFLITVLLVTVITVCMCSLVFCYENVGYYFSNTYLQSGKQQFAKDSFYSKKSKYCALQPYYYSIDSAGTYRISIYTELPDSYQLQDTDTQKVSVKTSSGFYTHPLYVEAGKDYLPYIRCGDGANINLRYLRVHYD